MVSLGCDVRVSAAGFVVQAVELAGEAADVGVDGALLVGGGGEVVAESCAGGEAFDGRFGGEVGRAADGGNPRAGGGEVLVGVKVSIG